MFCSIFPSASVWLNTDIEMSYVPKDWFGINISGNSEIFISVPDISKVIIIAYIVVLVIYGSGICMLYMSHHPQ